MSVPGGNIGPMTGTTAFDWRSFLLEWSGEWADSLPDGETRSEHDEAARRARWLGSLRVSGRLRPGVERALAPGRDAEAW
ncbi:hypothetical protein SGLAM104S_08315 [Streptomyces glaucescens]